MTARWAVVRLFVVAACLVALKPFPVSADTSATAKPWGRAIYNSGVGGDDKLTIDDKGPITGQSSSPALVGEAKITNSDTEHSVTWKGRPAGMDVFYTVWGQPDMDELVRTTIGGGAGPVPRPWVAWYDPQTGPRLVVVPYVDDLQSAIWPKSGNDNKVLVAELPSGKRQLLTSTAENTCLSEIG